MNALKNLGCEACRADAPKLPETQINAMLTEIPGWHVNEDNDIKKLQKTFQFENFIEALEFTNKIGSLAEENAHHPAILTEWGHTTVTWWTHKIKGLHKNDFIMAAKTDNVLLSG